MLPSKLSNTVAAICSLLSLVTAYPAGADEAPPAGVAFKYAAGHIILIPVSVSGKDSTFILDTGCGVNVLSSSLATSLGCKAIGKHSGRRMSGQKLDMQIVSLPALQLGGYERHNLPVASWKLDDLLAGEKELAEVQGLLSLNFFRNCAFTMDYAKQLLYIENAASLERRVQAGTSVPIKLTEHGNCETGIDVLLQFSNGKSALAEVDTGSGSLILDMHYLKAFGIHESDSNVHVKKGTDETGHSYVRINCELPATVFLAKASDFRQEKPHAQFQKIIHPALIGDSFLHNYTVTYDLPNKRMILAH